MSIFKDEFPRLRKPILYTIIFLIFSFCQFAFCQNYPEDLNLSTVNYLDDQSPTELAPEYLAPIIEELSGNRVTRISDSQVFGTTNSNLRHNYSTDQPWNSDGSLIKLAGYPAAILDGNTYEFLYWSDIPTYGRWSNTNPKIIFGVDGNNFVSLNVTSHVKTVIKKFDEFSSIDLGYGEGNLSVDDRFVGLIGLNNGERTLITYDILNNQIKGTKNLGSNGDMDWFSVSPSGKYAILSWREDGNGTTQGYKIYDINLTNERHLSDYTSHSDMGYDMSGYEVIVGFGDYDTWDNSYYIRMVRLSDGLMTPLFYWDSSLPNHGGYTGIWGGHISLRNANRPGWAYISEGCCIDHPIANQEVFAIKLDDSNIIERFAKHNSDYDKGYGHEAHAVPNRDGTKVMFSSNWDNAFSGNYSPSFIVEVPQDTNELVVANAGNDVTICEGDNTTLIASGGTDYLWSTGETSQSITVSPSNTTTYSVMVSNSSSSDTDNVVVTVNAIPETNAGDDVTIEEGQSTTLMALGGSTYQWSTGETSQSISVSPNITSTYTVIAYQNGCESSDEVIVMVNPTPPNAYAGEDVSICEGNGITLTASGGSDYIWSTGDTSQSITVSPNNTTTYIVTVSNGSLSDTDDVVVTVNPIPVANAGNDVTIEAGQSITLNASGGDSYQWSTGETTKSIIVSSNVTTTYSVTVSQNGCSDSDEVKVTVVALPVAYAGEDVSICEGDNTTLIASESSNYLWSTGETTQSIMVNPNNTTTYSVTVSNGISSDTDDVVVTVNPIPVANAGADLIINQGESATLSASGGVSYLWNTGQTSQNITVNPNTTTTYAVTAYQNGCSNTDEIIINVLTSDNVTANAGIDVSICEGNSVTLTASGGSDFLWSTGQTTHSISVNPNITTTYTVTVSNGKSSDSDEVIVTVNPIPITDAGNDVTIEIGQSTTLTGSGGTTYLWSTGEVTQSITVDPITTTSYSVEASQNDCSSNDDVVVTVITLPDANAGDDVSICEGDSTTLTASESSNYLWSTGETTQSITVSPNSTSTYNLTVSNGISSDSDDVIVTVNPIPVSNAGNDVTIESGESAILTASGGSFYQWNTGETTQSITVSPSVTTTYSVTAYQNGCSSTDDLIVSVVSNDTIMANAGNDVAICEGSDTTLTATGGSEFLWSTGETTQHITVSPNHTTVYTVSVSNGLATATAKVKVTVNNCKTPSLDFDQEDDIKTIEFMVYPNPTHDIINIKLSGLYNASSLHLYDILGKSLINETIQPFGSQLTRRTMDLSSYPRGIYLLTIIQNGMPFTKKIILN